jgi:hypothetical protein
MSYAEDLEIRYKGIDNIVLYARALWEENDGDLDEKQIEVAAALVDLDRRTDIDRLLQNYAVGVKAYPSPHVHLSAEYAYRMSDYSYSHDVDSTPNDSASGDRYPAFLVGQQLATHDLSLRTTLRLPADVGLVLRYDWLQTTIDTRADELDHIQSAQTRTHLIGSTLTWNPTPWWWTRAGANYVLSVTDTAANNYDTPVATFLRSFENDYVTTNVMTGFAVDEATEVELGYGWMYADNYHDISAATMPYGSDFTQHSVMARASHRFDEHTKLTGGYSYTSYDEAFAGGNYDYHAHLIFTAVELEY